MTGKKLYIASSWEDRRQAKSIMLLLESLNYIITEDWTIHEKARTYDNCLNDVRGIKNCDFFVLLNSGKKTPGKHVELGLAYGFDKKIMTVGKELNSVFKHLVGKHFNVSIEKHSVIVDSIIEYMEKTIKTRGQ